jgi:hypothetical protein
LLPYGIEFSGQSAVATKDEQSQALKGWREIAAYLGQPISVAQRWAHEGMPVEHKGRSVVASSEDLRKWLERESAGEPVQIASENIDLSAELRRGLSYVRKTGAKTGPKVGE